MSLIDRLRGVEKPKIPVHQFQAAMYEWADGAPGFTRVTIISSFALTPADEVELDWLKARWEDAKTNGKERQFRAALDNVLLLAENSDETGFYNTVPEITARLTAVASA